MANDDGKAKNLAAGAGAAPGTAPDGQPGPDAAPAEPELVINDAASLATAVSALSANDEEKLTRMYNKDGFRGLKGLNGIKSPELARMAGCVIRQIALNGDGGAQLKAIAGFTKSAGDEIEQEKKLSAYMQIADDLKIKRNDGETTGEFISRVGKAFAAAHGGK